jgi:hypothetical protein
MTKPDQIPQSDISVATTRIHIDSAKSSSKITVDNGIVTVPPGMGGWHPVFAQE